MRVKNVLSLTAILDNHWLSWSEKIDKVMTEANVPTRTKAGRMLNRASSARRHGYGELVYRQMVRVR